MATMYPLFFGLLLAAVCGAVGTGDGTVETQHFVSLRNRHINAGAGLPTRARIIQIASAELGVREATGRNDGKRVEEYLRYTDLGKGHQWCAAFVSWCYGQAGLSQPRNPWSPALFPKARRYSVSLSRHAEFISASQSITPQGNLLSLPAIKSNYRKQVSAGKQQMLSLAQHDVRIEPCHSWSGEKEVRGAKKNALSIARWFDYPQDYVRLLENDRKDIRQVKVNPADIFGIYSVTARRINHVGLVRKVQGKYLITIEGNSNDRVESRRRHLSTIYALADWVIQ